MTQFQNKIFKLKEGISGNLELFVAVKKKKIYVLAWWEFLFAWGPANPVQLKGKHGY